MLGATLQESLYSINEKKIVHSRPLALKGSNGKDGQALEEVQSIGGINLLTNNMVNFLSAGLTGAMVVWWARPK